MRINKQKIKNFIKDNKEYFIGAGIGIASSIIIYKIKNKINNSNNKSYVNLNTYKNDEQIYIGFQFDKQHAKEFYNNLTDILIDYGML